MNKLLRWEVSGAVFTILVGSMLHFVFEWSGSWAPMGVIGAVNESVWEHLKIGIWPTLWFGLLEYIFLEDERSNLVPAKTVAAYLIPAIIIIIFYSYTALLGENILAIDIISFVIAVSIGHMVSYRIQVIPPFKSVWKKISWLFIGLLSVLIVVFTFVPPHVELFRDPVTGSYGLS